MWRQDGEEVDRIPLEIQGGREAGYRSWSHKQNFPEDTPGEWRIDVMTDRGRRIGMLSLQRVSDDAQAGHPGPTAGSSAPGRSPADVCVNCCLGPNRPPTEQPERMARPRRGVEDEVEDEEWEDQGDQRDRGDRRDGQVWRARPGGIQ
ncbi:MAG: DUF2914 domain-containing protein [Halomonas sp.]|uniref:DUF2914 domain-containing protein n=1 Tax=Halomonas sp. TaxID=1486246 RepID=UPI002ACE92FC|nr:DUF2914 domain-containing protein [Halomonas sp.]MDZ7853559.1 DUF2914 domain-containing protein [Halomonas sp.]